MVVGGRWGSGVVEGGRGSRDPGVAAGWGGGGVGRRGSGRRGGVGGGVGAPGPGAWVVSPVWLPLAAGGPACIDRPGKMPARLLPGLGAVPPAGASGRWGPPAVLCCPGGWWESARACLGVTALLPSQGQAGAGGGRYSVALISGLVGGVGLFLGLGCPVQEEVGLGGSGLWLSW